MNDVIKIKRDVKDLEKSLLTKIDFNDRVIEIYEVYIGYLIEIISDQLITIYNIEADTNINVILCEDCNIYQYKQVFKEGIRN